MKRELKGLIGIAVQSINNIIIISLSFLSSRKMLRIFSRKFTANILCHISWLIRTKKQALLFLQTSIQKLTDREKSLSNVKGKKKRDERVKFDQPLWLQCHHHLGHYITSCKAVNASIVCFIPCYYWCLRNSYCLYILSSTEPYSFLRPCQ